jgi:hypothetical protein
MNSFDALRKMLPDRQVEAAELMVAMNNFTISYAKTLLAATPEPQLVPGKRARTPKGVTEEQLNLMRREGAYGGMSIAPAERHDEHAPKIDRSAHALWTRCHYTRHAEHQLRPSCLRVGLTCSPIC